MLADTTTIIPASQAGGRKLATSEKQIHCRNVSLVLAMLSVMPQEGITTLVNLSPFAGITRGIAKGLLDFVDRASNRTPDDG